MSLPKNLHTLNRNLPSCSPASISVQSVRISAPPTSNENHKEALERSDETKEDNPLDSYTNHKRYTADAQVGMASWRGLTKNRTITRRAGRVKWGRSLWISYFAFLFIAIAIQLIFGWGDWAFPDGRPSCSEDSGMAKNDLMCDLSNNLLEVVQQLRFLSAFILGGFVISSVQLWLTRRAEYTQLCGAARNLLINLCTIIHNERDRQLVSRWVVLGFELTVLNGRGLDDADEGRDYLVKLSLIQSDEWDSMVNGDRRTTVWYWIQMKVTMLSQNEVINRHECATICAAVTLLREKANDLMSPIARDQPRPYIFLCAVLVNVNLFLQSISKGIEWAIWMHDTRGGVWREPRMYVQVLGLFLFLTIYAMLFDVCGLLYNPFGPREIDIDHYAAGKGIRKLAQQLAKGSLPKTINSAPKKDNDWRSEDFYKKEEQLISHRVAIRRGSSISMMSRSSR